MFNPLHIENVDQTTALKSSHCTAYRRWCGKSIVPGVSRESLNSHNRLQYGQLPSKTHLPLCWGSAVNERMDYNCQKQNTMKFQTCRLSYTHPATIPQSKFTQLAPSAKQSHQNSPHGYLLWACAQSRYHPHFSPRQHSTSIVTRYTHERCSNATVLGY